MDPFTALGAASAILTFVDFAGKLLSGATAIYHSVPGGTVDNNHIDEITNDLANVTAGLVIAAPDTTANSPAVKDIAKKCHAFFRELQGLLVNIKASGDRKK